MPFVVQSAIVRRVMGASVIALAAGGATVALAQPPAPPPAADIPAYGPPLVGVCMFSRDIALNSSQAGVSLNQQIQQISQGIQAGLDPVRAAIAKDNQELMAQKAKLPAAQYQQRQAALQQRADAYSQTVQTRSAQIAQTREKALVQIATAVNPLLVATISAHHCSVVLDRNGVYGANPGMDLTPEVVGKLNASLPTVPVALIPPEALQGQR